MALVRRAIAGDFQAVEAVVRLWGPRIRRFASRLCPSQVILDAVQETLLVLSQRIGQLRAAEALTSWSFQIVKRYCLRVFATFRRESAIVEQLQKLDAYSPQFDPHQNLLVEQLIAVLQSLPERDRQILVLRDLENLSLEAVSVHLGLTLPAIKSRLHRARQALRRKMTS